MKNLGDTIIFSLTVVLFIIGVHQTMTWGIGNSYYLLMLSMGGLFYYKFRKEKRKGQEKVDANKKQHTKKTKKR